MLTLAGSSFRARILVLGEQRPVGQGDRDDLVGEYAVFQRLLRAVLAFDCERVLLRPRDPVPLRHDLGRLAERDRPLWIEAAVGKPPADGRIRRLGGLAAPGLAGLE